MPLDPDVAAVLAAMPGEALDLERVSPEQLRAGYEALSATADAPEMHRVEMRSLAGPVGALDARVYTPSAASLHPGLIYFHGGGFVVCSLDTHDGLCRELAAGTGCVVVSVDYRLAPEARFPAAPEDCYAATCAVAAEADSLGIDARRLAVAGDSAGGNLAAVVAQLCAARGGPALRHQLLIYPVTDHDFETDSYRDCAEGYFLTRELMRWFWGHYLEDPGQGADPLASPLRAKDLAGLPPATVVTAEFDPLRDEGRAYAARLAEAGVDAELLDYPGVIHGFVSMAAAIARGRTALDACCAALRSALAPEAAPRRREGS